MTDLLAHEITRLRASLARCLRYRHVTPWPRGQGPAKERERARTIIARIRYLERTKQNDS